jgi:serine/threonine-protein kinase
MDRPPIELRILGNTELSVAGERTGSFVLRQPKRLALLAYLALATAGGYRRRDQIVALFWPELDQAHARTQLRKVLHALRSTLGSEAFVTRGEEELRLDASQVWCDAVAFAGLIKEGQWSEALELYRGDLLEGLFPGGVGEQFETWLGDQRSTLREQASRAAWECSTREDLAGRHAEAVALARRGLELDPDDEEGVRRLIAVLDRYGDRAGALRLFREWQARLQAEYGADPAPETRKLARKVQAPRKGESLETPPAVSSLPPPESPPAGAPPEASLAPSRPERRRWASRKGVVASLVVLLATAVILGAVHVTRGGSGLEADNGRAQKTRVAVLPLRGLGDSSDARVGQGLAEELTTALAQLPGISVRSTARSREAVHAGGDVREIGRRLAVAFVLDGSVQHGAGRSRITLRLVRVADEVAVWARAFDVAMESEDLLVAQERVARATADELGARLDTLSLSPVP